MCSKALPARDCSKKLGLEVAYQHMLNIANFLGSSNKCKSRTMCVSQIIRSSALLIYALKCPSLAAKEKLSSIYSAIITRGQLQRETIFGGCFWKPYQLAEEIRCGRQGTPGGT